MPTPVRAQVIIHTDDAVSENFVTNSWCIDCTNFPSLSDLADYTADFDAFYTLLVSYFSNTVAQNGHEIKFYDLSQLVPPNYPIGTTTWNLPSNPGTDGLPSEVALCLSFQGERSPGFPQRRRRGRIYFGPLQAGTTSGGRPAAAMVTAMNTAIEALQVALLTNSNPATLSVWSPSDAIAVPVTDGWIDDAWDTQRRRGLARTVRTTWTV